MRIFPKLFYASKNFKDLLLQKTFRRVLLELVIVQVVVIILFVLTGERYRILPPGRNLLFDELVGSYCIVTLLWASLRWRLHSGARSRWRQALVEIIAAAFLCLEMALSASLVLAVLGRSVFAYDVDASYIARHVISIAIGMSFLFLFFRALIRLLLFWNHLRNTQLRWSLTHAHLMIVVIGAGVISVLVAVIVLVESRDPSRYLVESRNPFNILTFLFALLIITAIAIACVLPPSALFSFFFTRYLTRRIARLTSATSSLRRGDYSVRVVVDGQDEIARLQADFNAMATELERTMSELKTERDNVATLLRARRELIASASHELRTPVATVRSYMESALLNWEEQPPPTLKQDMQIMEQQTIRLQSLINDLFVLSRAEIGHLELRCEPTDVELLIKRVAETLAPVAWRGSRIEISAETSMTPCPPVLVDVNRLEQILHNLIHNAIQHTSPGGIIVISASCEQENVILQVKDTGEGIAAEDLPRIWERFYRAESSHAGSGTGLGLAIVKELTEAMGGTVAVESVLGQGSCFTICFPCIAMTTFVSGISAFVDS